MGSEVDSIVDSWKFPYPMPLSDKTVWADGKFQRTEHSCSEKVWNAVANIFKSILLPVYLVYAAARSLVSRCISAIQSKPKQLEFPGKPDIQKAEQIRAPGKLEVPMAEDGSYIPRYFGPSTSCFQDFGFGTRFGKAILHGKEITFRGRGNWEPFMTPEHLEGVKTEEDIQKLFRVADPAEIVALLQKLNANAYRFSMEWSILEPEPGVFDEDAIAWYQELFDRLERAHIEPWVTLHHFTHPLWLEKEGGFENPETVQKFVDYSMEMMKRFPKVQYWMSFNEPGVYGMLTRVEGDHPPGKKLDFAAAGTCIRNFLWAHCELRKKMREEFGDADPRVLAMTHQWLDFRPLEGEGNALERAICNTYSIFHRTILHFLETGQFHYVIPGIANTHFTVPDIRDYLDLNLVQFYGFPRIKAGLNGGKEYPGWKVTNICGFTFGSTCKEGGAMQSFGLSAAYPEDLEETLQRTQKIPVPSGISERGCDRNQQKWGAKEFALDDSAQAAHFTKTNPIVSKFPTFADFIWTLYPNCEWNRAFACHLGFLNRDNPGALSETGRVIQKLWGWRQEALARLGIGIKRAA